MLDAERLARMEQLYLRVLDSPPERRAAVLEESCSDDPDLLHELESLLEAREEAGSFLSPEQLCSHIGKLGSEAAAAAVGSALGPYRILAEIGSGAMGDVYRARDSRLERDLALKILPSAFTNNAERVARFQREAKAASGLNHPNIVTIYEIGQVDETWFIAEELIAGITLRQRLSSGKLPVQEVIEIGFQCAMALEAAHRAGIVHRDIKPENIMLRPDGVVKIVDFGLARIGEAGQTSPQATQAGSIMGTPRYMSPEQARGEKLDARSDIFSLGAVLFEMVCGCPAFPGASTAEVFAALLAAPPDLRAAGPLRAVLSRALQKDVAARYSSMGEFAAAIRQVDLSRNAERHSARGAIAVRLRWLFAAAAIGLAVSGIALFFARPVPPPRVLSTTEITNDRQAKTAPFLTNGSRLYFNTGSYPTGQPYQVSIEGGESVPLHVELPNASVMDISPDGSELLVGSSGYNPYAFNSATLWIAPIFGGSPRRVGDLVVGSAAWSPDGRQLVFTREREHELAVCRVDGTGTRTLATIPGVPSSPRWSPDGKKIRFSLLRNQHGGGAFATSEVPEHTLWEVSVDGTQLHAVLPAWRDAQCCGNWTRDGRYFVFESTSRNATTVWAMREKRGLLETKNPEPVQLTTGPMNTYGPVPSRDGKRVFVGGRESRIELVRYDSKGKNFVPFFYGTSAEGLDFSRDGKWVAYVSHPGDAIWRSDVNGGQRLQLTAPPLHASVPQWSPDGSRIAFMAYTPGGTEKVYVVNRDGGETQQLTYGENNSDPTWSSDGNLIAFGGYPIEPQASHNMAIEILNLSSHRVSVLPGSKGLWAPRWSRNGRYISALTADTQTLLLFDFHDQKWAKLAKAYFGYERWSADSEYIGFDTTGEDPAYFKVWIRDHRVERVVSLTSLQRKVGAFGAWAGLTPDGSPLIARDASFDEIYALDWEAR